jgi:hypothetical protein
MVPVAADAAPGRRHAFRNTLSADRNPLAFAFFFACLENQNTIC